MSGKRAAWQLVALMGLMGLLGGCKGAGKAPDAPVAGEAKAQAAEATEVVLPVAEQTGVITVAKVTRSEEPETLTFPGKIVLPDNETWRVGVLSSGRVEQVYANLGDYVKKGTVLARMHSHDVHDARAAYAMAKSDETRANAAERMAQASYDRVQRLYMLKAASVEQVELARQELVNTMAELENARTDVQRNKTHLEDNLGIPAEVPEGNGKGYSELIPILAPASGYILQKSVTPGTTVTPGTDAFVLGNLKQLWMLAAVGQESIAKVKTGQSAQVSLPGIPGQRFAGTVTNLGQAFDPTTRRLQIRIQLEGSSELLHPEMLANVEIEAGTKHPVMLVDSSAVQQVNGQDVVFVRQAPDRFAVRAVRLGAAIHGRPTVVEGLQPGEEIVTRGGFLLKSQLLKSAMQGD